MCVGLALDWHWIVVRSGWIGKLDWHLIGMHWRQLGTILTSGWHWIDKIWAQDWDGLALD